MAAWPDDPQRLVKRDSTGQMAAHKPAALSRVKAKQARRTHRERTENALKVI